MAQVKVILREDIPRLGDAGEVVSVRPGFARNFLLPQGKAILATEASVKALEHHQRVISDKVSREKKALDGDRSRLEAIVLEVAVRVGEEGKLFGSVTAAQIAELLVEKGVTVDRRKIELAEPIREVGEHRVPVRLHREVLAQVRLNVKA
ncbi:MAG: 50S ribosomal protein L9, partial [Myxococcota bacterium]